MIQDKNYKSRDGKNFTDPLECAKYEIENFPDILENIQQSVKEKPIDHQKNWCGYGIAPGYAHACACVGCINSQFREVGLSKYHWKVWVDSYRPKDDYDTSQKSFGIIITDLGTDKINLMKVLREVFQVSIPDVSRILKNSAHIVIKNEDYDMANWYLRKITNIETDAKFNVFYAEPENVMSKMFIIPIKPVNK